MRIKNYKKILLLLIFISFLIGSFCLAQGRELEIEYPTLPPEAGVEAPTKTKTALPEYLEYVFTFAIIIAGLLAFGALIYGGIRYLTSAGDPTKMSDAKNQVIAGFSGLVILLSSYLILNTINPQLVLPKKPPLQPAVAGIYAYIKADCIDEPEDTYDDRVLINEDTSDLSERLPKDEGGGPQSLQCIEFRSGKEILTVEVCSSTDFGGTCTPYEGDPGNTENVTGESIKLDYHPPGVYLYASDDNCTGDDYKIYQSSSATLPEFNDKTQSIKFRYGFRIIEISKDTSSEEINKILERKCTSQGGEIGLRNEIDDNYQYQCITEKYAVILHEHENYMGKAMLYDQDPTSIYNGLPPGCLPLSYNMYGGPTSIGASSLTVYLQPVGEPIGDGVRFWGDKNYTKEKDEYVLPSTTTYYGDDTQVSKIQDERKGSNDKITSMEMDGHYVALLFRGVNYKNTCEVFMGSDPNFRGIPSNPIGQCGWLGRTDCLSSFIIKARK